MNNACLGQFLPAGVSRLTAARWELPWKKYPVFSHLCRKKKKSLWFLCPLLGWTLKFRGVLADRALSQRGPERAVVCAGQRVSPSCCAGSPCPCICTSQLCPVCPGLLISWECKHPGISMMSSLAVPVVGQTQSGN